MIFKQFFSFLRTVLNVLSQSLGDFPFVRTNRPDHSRRNKNLTFNQIYPARSVIVCTKELLFSKTLWKKPISFAYWLVRQWYGRPVLTNGKPPLASKNTQRIYLAVSRGRKKAQTFLDEFVTISILDRILSNKCMLWLEFICGCKCISLFLGYGNV